jgi:hypothetical protein
MPRVTILRDFSIKTHVLNAKIIGDEKCRCLFIESERMNENFIAMNYYSGSGSRENQLN